MIAGIAQLVERNLAKVEVAGLSPVSRSNLAKWQSGNAAACKAVNAGSIPTLALKKDFIFGMLNICLLYTSDAADD